MELNINLDEYSGPLELLLELIGKEEIDIYNIPIHRITGSFLEEMKLRPIESERVAEFISMAAYLLEIKSKLLLPDHSLEPIMGGDEDPRYYLMTRLIEYQKVKETREFLAKRELPWRIFSDDLPILLPKPKAANLDFLADKKDLFTAMENLLNRWDDSSQELLRDRLKRENYSVMLQQREILTLLSYQERLGFSSFIAQAPKGKSVASFLALLKLAQDQRVLLHQERSFSDIFIERKSHGRS